MTSTVHQPSTADQFMRRLLRVEGQADPCALVGASSAMSTSIVVSAVRCTLTYLLIPLLTPVIGLLGLLSAPLGIALCAFASVMSVRSMRRFWIADHRYRWAYTAFASIMLCFLAVSVVVDLIHLFG